MSNDLDKIFTEIEKQAGEPLGDRDKTLVASGISGFIAAYQSDPNLPKRIADQILGCLNDIIRRRGGDQP